MQSKRGVSYAIGGTAAGLGSGTIVFNHGIGTDSGIWDEWVGELGSGRRIARFDLRGFGRSVVPPLDHRWSLGELIDDLMEIAEIASPAAPVHLVGESLGGTVVLAAAIRHPGRVASVTISNAAFRGSGINRVAGWRAEVERQGMAAWSDGMMELRFTPNVLTPERRAWFSRVQAASHAHVVLGLGEMLASLDLSEQLPDLDAPLLILMPDQSPFVPLDQAVELARLIPGAELEVFRGVRHGLPFSHGPACARRVAAFIAGRERGS